MDKKLEILNKYIDFSKDGVIEREDDLKAMQEYADLQLLQTASLCNADSTNLVECSNCSDKVEMISSGEFCPRCFC